MTTATLIGLGVLVVAGLVSWLWHLERTSYVLPGGLIVYLVGKGHPEDGHAQEIVEALRWLSHVHHGLALHARIEGARLVIDSTRDAEEGSIGEVFKRKRMLVAHCPAGSRLDTPSFRYLLGVWLCMLAGMSDAEIAETATRIEAAAAGRKGVA